VPTTMAKFEKNVENKKNKGKKKVELLTSMLHNASTTLCNHDYNKLLHSFKHDCCPNLKAKIKNQKI
jgi:hypothetical protein